METKLKFKTLVLVCKSKAFADQFIKELDVLCTKYAIKDGVVMDYEWEQ